MKHHMGSVDGRMSMILSTYSLTSTNVFEYLNQYGKYRLGLRQMESEEQRVEGGERFIL